MNGDRVAIAVWVIGLSLMLGYDLIAVIVKSSHLPTLTHVAVKYMSPWIVLPFFGWLFIHFITRFSQR